MQVIALDTETFLIERLKPFPQVVCGTLCAQGDRPVILKHDCDLDRVVLGMLTNDGIKIVGQNIAYDMGVLASAYPKLLPFIFKKYMKGLITDTMLRQQLYDIATGASYDNDGPMRNYSLNDLYELHFGETIKGKRFGEDDSWRLRYSELFDVPLEQWPAAATEYALFDAEATLKVFEAQEKQFNGLVVDDTFQAYAHFCLSLIAAQGIVTDHQRVLDLQEAMTSKMLELEPALVQAGLLAIDKKGKRTKKMKAARQRVLDACHNKDVIPLLTDKGQKALYEGLPVDPWDIDNVSIDKAAVTWCGDELMRVRSCYSEAEKILSTYVPFLLQGVDGPITTRFGLAVTGRTTSGAPREPMVGGNMQNAPRDAGVRECFVPRKGRLFVAADLAGAEMHTLAQTCHELGIRSFLGEVLNAGVDPHMVVAAQLLGVSYDEAKALYEAGDPAAKAARQDAKPTNFGRAGGMGDATFINTQLQKGVLWSPERAAAAKAAWLKAWPEMPQYFKYVSEGLGKGESVVMECLYSGRKRKVKGYSTACNNSFQALTADGAKLALCEVTRRCYTVKTSALYGCRPVNFIHDELVLEVFGDIVRARAAALELETVMAEQFNKCCPDFPTTVSAVLMDRWAKEAKRIVNKNGELEVYHVQ